jgi:cysteine desulfurase
VIYADHNASTPPLPEVVEAMTACLRGGWGNPGSRQHPFGRRALALVDAARADVAALLGARPDEVLFTSGATESCNLAVLGLGERLLRERPRLVTCATEHPAILEPLRRLAEAGAELVELPVGPDGALDPARLAAAMDERTGLVCLMLANNETGVIHDIPAAAALAHRYGALLVCDATQALGKIPVQVANLGADAVACTAHKMYGPQGCGALWLRRGLGLSPQLHGGGQERGLRPGTHNLPGIVGFGAAAAAAGRDLGERSRHLAALTADLEDRLLAALPGLVVHGRSGPRIPGTTMCTLPGLPTGWLTTLAGIAASGGSTCSTGSGSYVLRAMSLAAHDAGNSLRFGLGIHTTPDEVAEIAAAAVRGAAALTPAPSTSPTP